MKNLVIILALLIITFSCRNENRITLGGREYRIDTIRDRNLEGFCMAYTFVNVYDLKEKSDVYSFPLLGKRCDFESDSDTIFTYAEHIIDEKKKEIIIKEYDINGYQEISGTDSTIKMFKIYDDNPPVNPYKGNKEWISLRWVKDYYKGKLRYMSERDSNNYLKKIDVDSIN
ncbi:hypothetical protein [Sphingobacterium bovistauri]|uniref:Lipoprotein n=1 Tax=Sphingobacterium bovistauri TaxID=2781959 RepID=A0ABS7Z878_9SPHI|nr:hypothetical protein [Sphingobacterium bovistauri]MCA5005621.1 hypothetical protein [Sphingobacterium bovistauri]